MDMTWKEDAIKNPAWAWAQATKECTDGIWKKTLEICLGCK
jgi:hypothetical protein